MVISLRAVVAITLYYSATVVLQYMPKRLYHIEVRKKVLEEYLRVETAVKRMW